MAYSADDVRRLMADNDRLRRRADEHDAAIRRAAEEELSRLDVRLQSLPPGLVARDSAMAFEYRRMVDERARLLRLASGG